MRNKEIHASFGGQERGDRILSTGHSPETKLAFSQAIREDPGMIEMAGDSKELFYQYYEKYFVAKQGRSGKEVHFYALLSLAQIHQISNSPDTTRGMQVMHELMGAVLSEDQTREMYEELRKDSGLAQQS
jgi:hypothetical protein